MQGANSRVARLPKKPKLATYDLTSDEPAGDEATRPELAIGPATEPAQAAIKAANDEPANLPVTYKPSTNKHSNIDPLPSRPTISEPTISEPPISEPPISEPTVGEPTINEPNLNKSLDLVRIQYRHSKLG